MQKKALIFLIVFAIAIGLVVGGYQARNQVDRVLGVIASASPTASQLPVSSPASITLTVIADDTNALEMLQKNAAVEYKKYDFGVMVESINGIKADQNHYWALYVNDVYSQAGADQTELKNGDIVKWVYEEIKPTK